MWVGSDLAGWNLLQNPPPTTGVYNLTGFIFLYKPSETGIVCTDAGLLGHATRGRLLKSQVLLPARHAVTRGLLPESQGLLPASPGQGGLDCLMRHSYSPPHFGISKTKDGEALTVLRMARTMFMGLCVGLSAKEIDRKEPGNFGQLQVLKKGCKEGGRQ